MLLQFYIQDASPKPRVSAGRDCQTYQLSPTHLNPLLRLNRTHCSHENHHQRQQTLSSRHCRMCYQMDGWERLAVWRVMRTCDDLWGDLEGVYIVDMCYLYSYTDAGDSLKDVFSLGWRKSMSWSQAQYEGDILKAKTLIEIKTLTDSPLRF